MGEVFAGRYELLDPIASGGMGTVWRVHDRSTDDVLAAKVLRQTDAAMLLRFVREQSVRIDHSHVVTPRSWAGVDDRVLFTMPLVRGGSVSDLARRNGGRLPPRWIAALGDQTLQALEAVHAAGIVHRDIKPGNLLLEPTAGNRPHLRLTDFGIAVPADEPRLTHVAMVIGTPGYLAPEQARGGDPDPRSDVYSVGVVLLEMLTGHRPPSDALPAPIDVAGLRGASPEHDAILDVVAAATAYDISTRPTAAELRGHPALAALVSRWDDPALADDIVIADAYPPADQATTSYPPPTGAGSPIAGQASAFPPPPPPPGAMTVPLVVTPTRAVGAGATRFDGSPTPTSRRTPLDAVALLVLGVIGLIAAFVLLIG